MLKPRKVLGLIVRHSYCRSKLPREVKDRTDANFTLQPDTPAHHLDKLTCDTES